MVRSTTGRVSAAAVAALLLAVGLIAGTTTSAAAYTTYTPSGGPGVKLVGSGMTVTDLASSTELSLRCATFDLTGPVTSPGTSRAYGATAASLPTVAVHECTHPLAGACPDPVPVGTWTFAITGDVGSGGWPARLGNVKVQIDCGDCAFTVGGTIQGRFAAGSAQAFTPVSGPSGAVITTTPVGTSCAALDVALGDPMGFTGSWSNLPPAGSAPLILTNP